MCLFTLGCLQTSEGQSYIFMQMRLIKGAWQDQESCSLTEQVVPRQRVQDAGRSDQVTHGGGQRGRVNADRHEGMPDVNVSEKPVIFLQEDPRERRSVCENMAEESKAFWESKEPLNQ